MDVLGVPLSLGAAVIGGVQGQLGGLLNKYFDYKLEAKLADDRFNLDNLKNIRSSTNKQFTITRRILAIMVMTTLCLSPIIAAYLKIPIYVPYSDSNGFIKATFSGDSTLHWLKVEGLPILPELSYATMFIVGLYFGGKRV